MKIRCGFVTNSSSSSFIIGFSKRSKKSQAAKQILTELLKDDCNYYMSYNYEIVGGIDAIKERLYEETLNEIVPKMKKGYEYYYVTMDNYAFSLISIINLLKDAKAIDVVLSFDD